MANDNPFKQLSGLKKSLPKDEKARTRKKREQAAKEREEAARCKRAEATQSHATEQVDADDAETFARAMGGVERLEAKGRDVARPAPKRPAAIESDDDPEALQKLKGLASGSVDFDIEYSDEYQYGHIRGLDSRLFQKLKSGAYSVEGHTDLHGLTLEAAHDALVFFVRESYLAGRRCVLVVTGRGRNSPGGQGLIKLEVQNWLTREPLKRAVLAFCTALPRDGGPGALYLLLRRQRKNGPGINFDRTGFLEP